MEYKLYCFAQSGYAYKVALTLKLAGADWEPRWVDFFQRRDAHARIPSQVKSALGILNLHLKDKKFSAADRLTIADLSMCGYLFWPDEFGVSWTDYPAIGAWLERIRAQPGWVHPYELMPGHPLPPKK